MYARDGAVFPSYGAYLRSKGVRVAYARSANGWDYTKQKRWDSELQAYRDAVGEGLDPTGTTMRDIDSARRKADEAQEI
jgi:hypothetical protein